MNFSGPHQQARSLVDWMALITLRAATEGDETFFFELFTQTHGADLGLLGMPQAALDALTQMQYRGRNMSYRAGFPDAEDSVVSVDGEAAGRLVVDRSGNGLRVVDVAIVPALQGKGIGTELLSRLTAEAAAKALPLRLQVRVGSAAVRLYRRLGFVETGSDDAYVAMEWRP